MVGFRLLSGLLMAACSRLLALTGLANKAPMCMSDYSLEDPLQRAMAEEPLERGDIFDRDGLFVPMLMNLVGVSDEQMDVFMTQVEALPA
jgi:hypothetical protein